ncbi:Protein SERAC1 [Paramyrothecium foliicola]|nr:Protein SERAC1 [Paramyrothecium foliicola]
MDRKPADLFKKVFRVRGLPNDVKDCADAAGVVTKSLGFHAASDVSIFSLATTLDYWETPPSKVATMQFKVFPKSFGATVQLEQWLVPLDGSDGVNLIFDTHFLGLTPLNDVLSIPHTLDCIAISGLGSHPFGSWQPHGSDKSFMWVRDELPRGSPGVRAILYGYDTSLIRSTSFQSISDIARGLIEQLRANGCHNSSAKPLIFLAHSLGGIVLKDALVQLADARNDFDHSILDKIFGAIMFGVPSLGMEQSHLMAIVDGQVNETLVEDLSRDSQYLQRLDKAYHGQNPLLAFPIDANHSEIIKFTKGSQDLRAVLARIYVMMNGTPVKHKTASWSPSKHNGASHPDNAMNSRNKTSMDIRCNVHKLLDSLQTPDLDSRFSEIEDRFKHTLDWIFEMPSFTDWLQHGTGIFWISGKPGSGKSTLMKFILRSRKTWDLLHGFGREASEISAGFFFHFRGTVMQKSFEGVLRSLLKQIIQKCLKQESCHGLLVEINDASFAGEPWSVSELERCLMVILNQQHCRIDLCLFFDALDEFDGHHKLICAFLNRLVQSQEGSLTRVKVCFSSRPWQIFETNFEHCPGFPVHEHTQEDIRDYCLGTLSVQIERVPSVLGLVPRIADRAAGVFLWVRLVLDQVLSICSSVDSIPLASVQHVVETLPTELDSFYDFIIQRIPWSQRWNTYALLELVTRAHFPADRDVFYVMLSVVISSCALYKQACEKAKLFASREDGLSSKTNIAKWSGGLVEIIAHPLGGTSDLSKGFNVQFMHQTVYEFATSTRFKQRILGDLAKLTHENGHSFHARSQVLERSSFFDSLVNFLPKRLSKASSDDEHTTIFQSLGHATSRRGKSSYHARQAEATTGRSQKEFLDSLPPKALSNISMALNIPQITTVIELAAYDGLQLYICDVLADTKDMLQRSRQKLFTCMFSRGQYEWSLLPFVEFLLSKGFTMHEGVDMLVPLMQRAWVFHASRNREEAEITELL